MSTAAESLPTIVPDPTCFGACTGCGRHGVPYEHRGLRFGGLCAYRGERLCPACRDAALEDQGVDILVVSYQPQVPPHVVSSVRDRDTVFIGLVTPQQRGGYSHTPARKYVREAAPAADGTETTDAR